MSAKKDKAKQHSDKGGGGGGKPAPSLTDEQRRNYEMLGMLPSAAPPPQPTESGMGMLDVLAITENGPPASNETVTLPSGTTIRNEPVPLGNGLVGVESTVTVPGHEPVTSVPSVGISPREAAGFYTTNPFYTPQQRDRDLALTAGTLMGPHTLADRAAAAARLDAHWNQSAAPRHPGGALLLPGPGYSSTELVRDLQWASTTGPLDALGEQRRTEAANRLWRLGAYTRQEQESDQLTAQLGNYTLNHPRYREELRTLLLDGVSRDDADTILADRAAAARLRLQQAGIPVMDLENVDPLRNNQFLNPVDPDNPLVAVPDGPPPPINSVTEPEFRAWIGEMTGLGDLGEGLETGNYGQAAFGAGMTLLTFAPGVIVRPLGKGFRWLGDRILGEAGAEAATQLGRTVRPGWGGAGDTPLWRQPTAPLPGRHLPEATPPNSPRGELPPSSQEAVPRVGGTEPASISPPPAGRAAPPPPGGGEGHVFDLEPRSSPALQPGHPAYHNPGEYGGYDGPWQPPESGVGGPGAWRPQAPWRPLPGPGRGRPAPELPPGRTLPEGVRRGIDKRNQVYWTDPHGRRVDMESWDTVPSETLMRGKLADEPLGTIPMNEVDAPVRGLIDEQTARYDDAIRARREYEAEIQRIIDERNLTVTDGSFSRQPLTIDQFTSGRTDETIGKLVQSGQLDHADPIVRRLEELSAGRAEQRGIITSATEKRGEIGGDHFADENNIEIIYAGKYGGTADRIGIVTDADGNRRVVLLEYKGGESIGYSPRTIDVGGHQIRVEQGTYPYAQDEFLRPDSGPMKALEQHDPELARRLRSGEESFDYVVVHTDSSGTITAHHVDPQTAKDFRLAQPPNPPALPPGTRDATPIAGTGAAPAWLTGLVPGGPPTFATWTAPIAAAGAAAAHPAIRARQHRRQNQSLVLNLLVAASHGYADRNENARVLTYGAHIR
ncbi:hypothetical protein AB0H71_06795 [Nocardia sp. NPDC050697]|uniref:hypothetical protein n=1 Tax=Nocardia sp. NPDC050697 TaxID=3155158 RepID=UPI0033CCF197